MVNEWLTIIFNDHLLKKAAETQNCICISYGSVLIEHLLSYIYPCIPQPVQVAKEAEIRTVEHRCGIKHRYLNAHPKNKDIPWGNLPFTGAVSRFSDSCTRQTAMEEVSKTS